MPIEFHPKPGAIVVCDYNTGFIEPEMVKRRPVIVLSPQIGGRAGLCTVVPLSTRKPDPIMAYHCEMNDIDPPLPYPWDSQGIWVKGDMVSAVSFARLELIRLGKDANGERLYRRNLLSDDQMKRVRSCVLHAMGMAALIKGL